MLLQDYRKSRGLSQKEAAKELDLNWTTIWRWESGKSIPETVNIRKIQAWSCGQVTANDFIKNDKPAG